MRGLSSVFEKSSPILKERASSGSLRNLLMLNRSYETDLTDAAWELVKPRLPAAGPGGRPRTTDVRAVLNAIVYLLQRVANGASFHTSSRHEAPSTTTFGDGKTLGSGCNYTAPSMNKRVSRQDARGLAYWAA